MKIAILSTIQDYEWAGTEQVWWQFARYALVQGHHVTLAAHKGVAASKKVSELQESGLNVVIRNPFHPTRVYLLKEKWFSDHNKLFEFKPDVLLINSGSLFDVLNLPYLLQLCNKLACPKVFFCHFVADGLQPINRSSVRRFLSKMNAVVFVSEHNKKLAERQLAIKLSAASAILNESKLVLKEPLPWPEDSLINLACVARLEVKWKGQDVLLELLASKYWLSNNWHLNLYGIGPDEDYITELIKLYDLSDRVSLYGYVDQIEKIWEVNHILLLPSKGEGTPLAVLEAMMCGRPTVTTDVGGNKEILHEGKTGWIADVATPNVFNKKLEEAWQNRKNWKMMGMLAHEKSLELSKTNPPQQLLEIIESV